MLILTRSAGTAIIIGDHIVLKVIQVNGDKVRLGVEAPREIQIQRAHNQGVESTDDVRPPRLDSPLQA